MMSPTSITHIANLDHDCIINLTSSLTLQIFEFFLHIVNCLLSIINSSASCGCLIFSPHLSLEIVENFLIIIFLVSININIDIVNFAFWVYCTIINNRLIVLSFTIINR